MNFPISERVFTVVNPLLLRAWFRAVSAKMSNTGRASHDFGIGRNGRSTGPSKSMGTWLPDTRVFLLSRVPEKRG